MLHQTRAIILRSIAYGDSSLIVSAFTEKLGLQQYMVKGARKVGKKGGSQAGMYQPGAILDMLVYHYPQKQLNYVKEVKWGLIYQNILTSVVKHSVAIMMVEMMTKCLKEPEPNLELFDFFEQYLRFLDGAEAVVTANMPLHFMLQLAGQLGFTIENNYGATHPVLDLQEGRFTDVLPPHGYYLQDQCAAVISQLLATENPVTLYRIKLNIGVRRQMLSGLERFFELHVTEFGKLKTIPILEAVLS